MDAVIAQRVNKLAHSLKELHLAVSSDEAYKRAQEIILGSFVQKDQKEDVQKENVVEEKTLSELMGETKEAVKEKIVEEIIIDSAPKESDEQTPKNQ